MRTSIEELAVFGNDPVFQEKLLVGLPNMGTRESLLKKINDILDKRWFTNNGKYVQELEQKIA
jgi:dTDP-4-amino-4,6-dideoxygalactose transaminase